MIHPEDARDLNILDALENGDLISELSQAYGVPLRHVMELRNELFNEPKREEPAWPHVGQRTPE